MSLKEFHLDLATSLVGDFHSKKRHNQHPAPPTNLTLLHFTMKRLDQTTGKAIRCRCWYWWSRRNKRRNDTSWYCHECQRHFCHTGLQDTDCFCNTTASSSYQTPVSLLYAQNTCIHELSLTYTLPWCVEICETYLLLPVDILLYVGSVS